MPTDESVFPKARAASPLQLGRDEWVVLSEARTSRATKRKWIQLRALSSFALIQMTIVKDRSGCFLIVQLLSKTQSRTIALSTHFLAGCFQYFILMLVSERQAAADYAHDDHGRN